MTAAMRLNGGQLILDGEKVSYPEGFTVTVMTEGLAFGKAEPLVRTLNTLMTQGTWEVFDRFNNRAPALVIKVEGHTPDGLNAGEVWLSGLMGPGTLEWLPPDQTVWTVFDVVSSYIDRSEDTAWEYRETQWIRHYRIPIKALPSARSPELTVTPAQPAAAVALVDELVTDGSSATGWTAGWSEVYPFNQAGAITPSVTSGRLRATRTTPAARGKNRLWEKYVVGSTIPDATPYLRVDFRANLSNGTLGTLVVEDTSGAIAIAPIALASVSTVSAGLVSGTAYYRLPTGTVAVTVETYVPEGQSGAYLEVDQLRRVSRLPDAGTNRQKIAAIYPGGSAPADGSLHVGHGSAGLGKVLLYTYPLGRPSPALMQYRSSAQTPIPDTSAINGERIPIGSGVPTDLTIPEPLLPTRGRAALWAKVQVDTAPTNLIWTVFSAVNGELIGLAQSGELMVPVGTSILVPLGLITLPGATTGSAGAVVVRLSSNTGGTITADEVWACGQDEYSALTIVDAGSGTPVSGGASNHMWINAPSPENPAGEVLIGTGPADARWPSVIQAGPQVHKFPSKGVSVLAVTCGATDASTDFTHYMRWTHHAAKNS